MIEIKRSADDIRDDMRMPCGELKDVLLDGDYLWYVIEVPPLGMSNYRRSPEKVLLDLGVTGARLAGARFNSEDDCIYYELDPEWAPTSS